MLPRQPRRIDLSSEQSEVNMLPLMNIIMLLIPFLILSSQFIKLGTIDVSAPPIQDTSKLPLKPAPTQPLRLTVSVTRLGLTLMTRGGKLAPGCDLQADPSAPGHVGPTIRKRDGNSHLLAFRRCLLKIKQIHPSENQIVLMAEPSVAYETIIHIMDASRYAGKTSAGKPKPLFPMVALSAGVL